MNTWHSKGSSKQYPLFINYINQVFKFAINIGVTNQNPVINVIVPKNQDIITSEKKIKFYTKDQLQIFLKSIEQSESTYITIRDYTLFRLLAFSGCRIGELLALTWDDLNIKTGELQINKTIAKSDHYYVSNTPKQRNQTEH